MKKNKITLILTLIFIILSYSIQNIKAAELITNGGFETGNFTGWTAINAANNQYINWTVSGSGSGGGFSPVPTATAVQQGSFNAWNGVTAGANTSYILFQQVTVPATTVVYLRWIDRYQMNYTSFCSTGCGTASYFVEITNTSNVVLQTLYTVTTLTNTNTNTGFVNHYINLGTTYAGQTIRIRFRTLVTQTLQGPGQLEVDAVSMDAVAPTAASASVSGRVTTEGGRGISFANVTLTDLAGNARTATTNQFGMFYFEEVEAGQTYIISVGHKKYTFPNNSRVINVGDELTDVDFTANP